MAHLVIVVVEVFISLERYVLLIRFGNDLLSHVLRRSTISAAALNCRVRDGIGCFARAMITKPKKKHKTSAGRMFMQRLRCSVIIVY